MAKVGFIKKALLAAVIAAMGASANRAKADTIVFANFLQTNPSDKGWAFSDTGATSTFNITSDAMSVLFVSAGGANEVLSYNGSAVAHLTSQVTGAAVVDGTQISQGITGTLQFTSGATNVLTVNFTGAITGTTDSHSSSTNADSSISGQAIVYSSDYAVVPFIGPFSFSIAMSQSPVLALADDGYLASFNASTTGNFAMDQGAGATPTPLPAAMWGGLSMISALGGAGAIRRRRRA